MELFLQADTWIALLTLTFLEIVLGIDNIIFISIAANKLPKEKRKKATNIGLVLAMVLRIILLFGISYIIAMKAPFWTINLSWIQAGITGQSLILFVGGIFLLYKSTQEIHHKVEGKEDAIENNKPQKVHTLKQAVLQITLINIVFSFDSILNGSRNDKRNQWCYDNHGCFSHFVYGDYVVICKSCRRICKQTPNHTDVGFGIFNSHCVYADSRRSASFSC